MREIETGLVRGYSSGDMIMQGIAGCKTQEADRQAEAGHGCVFDGGRKHIRYDSKRQVREKGVKAERRTRAKGGNEGPWYGWSLCQGRQALLDPSRRSLDPTCGRCTERSGRVAAPTGRGDNPVGRAASALFGVDASGAWVVWCGARV